MKKSLNLPWSIDRIKNRVYGTPINSRSGPIEIFKFTSLDVHMAEFIVQAANFVHSLAFVKTEDNRIDPNSCELEQLLAAVPESISNQPWVVDAIAAMNRVCQQSSEMTNDE